MTSPAITFTRVANGVFHVTVDGAPIKYEIINSCLGVSGHGKNEYGISHPDNKFTQIGSLQKAKKTLIHWIIKQQIG